MEPEETRWVLTRVSMAVQRVRAGWGNAFSPSKSLEEGSKATLLRDPLSKN